MTPRDCAECENTDDCEDYDEENPCGCSDIDLEAAIDHLHEIAHCFLLGTFIVGHSCLVSHNKCLGWFKTGTDVILPGWRPNRVKNVDVQ